MPQRLNGNSPGLLIEKIIVRPTLAKVYGIPYLKFNLFIFGSDYPSPELDPDSRLMLKPEAIVDKLKKEARFADTCMRF